MQTYFKVFLSTIIIDIIFLTSISAFAYTTTDYKQAKTLYAQKNYKEAADIFSKLSQERSDWQDFSYYYLGVCLEKINKQDEAIQTYQDLLTAYPSFYYVDTLRQKISDYNFDETRWGKYGASDIWQKAKNYYNRGSWTKAKNAFLRYQELMPNSNLDDDIDYYLAVANYNLGSLEQARIAFEKTIAKQDKYLRSSEFYLVQLLEKQKKYPEAENMYQKLIAKYGDTETGLDALEALIKLYRTIDKDSEASEGYLQIADKYRNHWRARKAFFQLGRLSLLDNNWPSANYYFDKTSNYSTSGLTRAEILHYLAMTYSKIDNTPKQTEILQKLATDYPYTYYGYLAQDAIGQKRPEQSKNSLPSYSYNYWANRIPRFHLFSKLEEYDDVAILLKDYKSKQPTSNIGFSLFTHDVYLKAKDYYSAQKLGETIWNSYKNSEQVPREIWELSYPVYYKDEIWPMAQAENLDPYLVLALIREESRFNKDVFSYAGAVGLMQLMPATAKAEAKGRKIPEGNLLDPSYNLKIGILHFGYLVKAYKGNYSYALAAYNGGINATNRWIQANRNLPEPEFTEKITYEQSRYYVKKVLQSYWTYKWLYASPL